MSDQFITIWNQLVLLTQFPVYGDIRECFDKLEKQVKGIYEEGHKKLSTLQMLALMNSIRAWRDILVEQSAETGGEEGEESDRKESVAAQ